MALSAESTALLSTFAADVADRTLKLGFTGISPDGVFARERSPETVDLLFLHPEVRFGELEVTPLIAFDNKVFRQLLTGRERTPQRYPRIATAHLGPLAGFNRTTWYFRKGEDHRPSLDEIFSFVEDVGQLFYRAWPEANSVAQLVVSDTGIDRFRAGAVVLLRTPELMSVAKNLLVH